MPTIVRQIETVEGHIQKCEDALDRIERSLRLEVLTDSQRQNLLEEEKQLKKKLKSHEQELRTLRKENWKSMVVSVIILGVVYISYTFFFQL
ncbi:hypothetical protein CHS0354_023031 [Potamilus streckersoni]|uniref:Coiled-coil domain-containing protein 167 n=1 Tax=Potamilus streckersoni TaxID=2493646 RepID=A0AAE0RW76_9BIVA|nr:hypothetical protein CHS0354_023031 [Potamilus streckersoni]